MTVVIVILVAALVAIVVGVVVLPSSSNDEESVSATESSSTVDEMTSPFFAALPNATMASLQDVESPQSQALELLFGHPNYGTMEDWKRIQPFAMVTIYFAPQLGHAKGSIGRYWLQHVCQWLDDTDDCTWDGRIREINLKRHGLYGTIPVEVSLADRPIAFGMERK